MPIDTSNNGQCQTHVDLVRERDALLERVTILEASEQRYKGLIERFNEVIWDTDESGAFSYVSPAIEKLTGLTPKQLVGARYGEVEWLAFPGPDLGEQEAIREVKAKLDVLFNAWQPGDPPIVEEQVHFRPDGSFFDAELTLTPKVDAEGKIVGLQGVTRDISDRKRAEESRSMLESQLLQAQKMEALGRLSGAVAHDFNNLLTVIIGNTELVLDVMVPDEKARSRLTEVLRSSEQAARVVHQMLTYGRRQAIQRQAIDVSSVVLKMQPFIAELLDHRIKLSVACQSHRHHILADQSQLEQIVMNLVINARDAIPSSGKITVKVANTVLTQRPDLLLADGEYVSLSVIDDGVGIDPRVVSRVFEPFYSTKPVTNVATGFGLATVYRIVHESSGGLELLSEQGVGSTFIIYFPRLLHTLETATQPKIPLSAPDKASATILIAEDNALVAAILKSSLEKIGHRVLLGCDGQVALALAKHHGGPIDLLITDVDMPRMGGLELAHRLAVFHRETTVLYVSGHRDELTKKDDLGQESQLNFLQKPFSPHELAERVQRLLTAGTTARSIE